MEQQSYTRYCSQTPDLQSRRDVASSNQPVQVDARFQNQQQRVPDRVESKMKSDTTAERTNTNWHISEPSKHITVSAETKARWELLRALAGVKHPEDAPSASVNDPSQIPGPHPHEIVAAQVLQASTKPQPNAPGSIPPATGITRRNASHGRRPQPPDAAPQAQPQSSGGSHRLRPLMLPKMVNRSNSGRSRPGSNSNVPIVRPSPPQQDGNSGLSPPLPRIPSRKGHEQRLSQAGIHAPKPVQPASAQMLSGLASGLFAVGKVPSAAPRPFAMSVPPAPNAISEDSSLRGAGSQMGGLKSGVPPTRYQPPRPDIAVTPVAPNNASAHGSPPMSNERIPQHAPPSNPAVNPPSTELTVPTSLADKDPEELMMLLASGDPAIMAFLYTEEGLEWLVEMFLYGSVLLAKSWVDEKLLSVEARKMLG